MGTRVQGHAELAILGAKHLVVASGDVCRKRLFAQPFKDEIKIFKSEELLRKL